MLGNLFALGAAIAWAVAVVLFKKSGEHFDAFGLNWFKSVVALLLFAVTLPLAGIAFFPGAPTPHLLLLLGSGVVGIAVADTLFFRTLTLIGAARAAIVSCLYTPLVAVASMLWLGESPTSKEIVGGLLVVSAVLLTQVRGISRDLAPGALPRGILLGALAMAANAGSVVAVKPILAAYPVVWSSGVRLVGGTLGLTLLAPAIVGGRRGGAAVFAPQRGWWVAIPAAFLGTYLSVMLWLAGFKYGATNSAAVLNQTTTLFTVVLAAIFLRERFTPWHGAATVLAFAGAAIIVW
jgi:drug/metabolite transporter (DMT)-like permease